MAKVKKSGLLSKLGTAGKKAVKAHREDEVRLSGGGDLPAGINNGIARLVECKFDTFSKGDNEGEYYFFASGVVLSPEKAPDGTPVTGLRTQIGPEPLCETPNRSRQDIDSHIEWILNELRKLGVETDELEVEDLEQVVAALKEEAPTFRFRTWQGEATEQFPNPRVNHDWRGVCEYEEDEEDEDVEEDEEEEEEGEELDEDDDEEEEEEEEGDEEEEEEDEEDEEEDVITPPEKEEVYLYKPPHKRKHIQCEVTSVFAKSETCNLKSVSDGAVFKKVPWSELTEE